MKEIIMPKLGLTMEEGILIRWLVGEGDQIEKGDVIFEVETDKAINEVEAPISGTIGKIFIDEEEVVPILTVIGYILEPGEEPPDVWPIPSLEKVEPVKSEEVPQPPLPAEEKTESTKEAGEPVKASPRAKRIAAEMGISLDRVIGTGPGGRIVEQDVLDYSGKPMFIQPSKVQMITAQRMTESFTSVPHFYLQVEVNASSLVALRKQMIPKVEQFAGVHLTVTDLFVFLAARTLAGHPKLNATWENDGIRLFDEINIGLATAYEGGLIVPVIKQADKLSLLDISKQRNEYVKKAQERKLGLDNLEGGTFTISNLGMKGIDSFSAIINPPQSAILAVGRITDRVVAVEGKAVIRPMVTLTLTVDHRVLDGSEGADFLIDLRKALEMPEDFFLSVD